MFAQKQNLEAQIEANEQAIKSNEEKIQQNEQKIQTAQKEIESLQQEYDKKNQEADKLNKEISEKISKILEDSNSNVAEERKKIEEATQEANDKVAAGELTEEEVAQYVAQKVGNPALAASTQDFAAISSLLTQVKALIEEANNCTLQMTAKQTNINSYQANISTSISENESLEKRNKPLQKQLVTVTNSIIDIEGEINTTNKEIASIDNQMAVVNGNIQSVQNSLAQLNGTEVTNNYSSSYTPVSYNEPGNKQEKQEYVDTPSAVSKSNPFLAVSYDFGSYTNMTEALDAMVQRNQNDVNLARNTVEADKQEIRRMYEELIA